MASLVFALLVLLASVCAAECALQTQTNSPEIFGSLGPRSFAEGDFDGDGFGDMILGSFGGVRLLRWSVASSSLSINTLITAGEYLHVAAGDMDGDADLDLATVDSSGLLYFAANNGSGSFAVLALITPTVLSGANTGRSLWAADLSGDGRADLVHSTTSQNGVAVRLSLGGGAFAGPVVLSLPGLTRLTLLADLDSVNGLDVVCVTTLPVALVWLANNGSGSMSAWRTVSTDPSVRYAATGDMDADGDVDVAALTTLEVVLFANNGTGGGWTSRVLVRGGTASSESLSLGDVNADGALDIVVNVDITVATIGVFTNDGRGSFQTYALPAAGSLSSYGTEPRVVRVGPRTQAALFVMLNTQNQFAYVPLLPLVVFSSSTLVSGPAFSDVAVVDLNADGFVDLVAGTPSGLMFWPAIAPGVFSGRSTLSQYALTRVIAADLNNDGAMDVIGHDSSWLIAYVSVGGAALSSATVPQLVEFAYVADIDLGDCDGDGDIDAVFSTGASHPWLAVNNGTGFLRAALLTSFPTCSSLDLLLVRLAELSGDTKADLIYVCKFSVFVSIATGNASFGPAILAATFATSVYALDVGEFTGDGWSDVLVTGFQTNPGIVVLANPATGSFASPRAINSSISAPAYYQQAFSFDYDDDGDLDLTVVGTSTRTVFANNGSGVFASTGISLACGATTHASMVDLDNTGTPVIVMACGTAGVIAARARPSVSLARPWLSMSTRLPANCHGVASAVSCLAAAVTQASSGCWVSSLSWRTNVTGCLLTALPLDETPGFTLAPDASAFGPGRAASITCDPAAPARRALFTVKPGARLELVDWTLELSAQAAALAKTGPARSPLSVCSESCDGSLASTLVLSRVTIRGFSNRAAPVDSATLGSSSLGHGAVAVFAGASLQATAVRFDTLAVANGGAAVAVLGSDATVLLANCSFVALVALGSDSASAELSAARTGGGALLLAGARAAVRIDACVFSDTRTDASGGALVVMATAADSSVRLTNVSFTRCSAGLMGGALAVLGAARTSVTLASGTRFVSCSAPFGGALAAASSVLGSAAVAGIVPPAPLLLASAGALSEDRPHLTSTGGLLFASSRASYGGSVFSCGAPVALSTNDVVVDSVASVAGGFAYNCRPVAEYASSGFPWVTGVPTTALAASSAAEYGPTVASAPAVLTFVRAPRELVSGASGLVGGPGSGFVLRLADAFNQSTPARGTPIQLAVASSATVAGDESVAEMGSDAVSAEFTVAAAAVGWPDSLGQSVTVAASVVGADASLSTSLVLRLVGCPVGWGRTSAPLASAPLECAQCADGLGSNRSAADAATSACVSVPVCTGDTLLDGVECVPCPLATVKTVAPLADDDGLAAPVRPFVCACMVGFWTPRALFNVSCAACPLGGVCDGGLARPRAARGFYGETDPRTAELVFVACPNADACIGASLCARGYRGRLCGQCADGFYALNGRCLACERTQTGLVSTVLVLLAAAALALAVWLKLAERTSTRFVSAMIGLSALQIVALFGALRFDWGPLADTLFSVVSVLSLNLQLASPECSLARGVDPWTLRYAAMMAAPLLVLALAAAVSLAVWAVRRAFGRPASALAVISAGTRSWVHAMVFLQLPLVSVALSPFGCRRDAAGQFIMLTNPSQLCYSPRWWRIFPAALVFSLVYGLVAPAVLFGWLARTRARVERASFELRFGFVVARFRDEFWAFEAAFIAMRVVLVLVLTASPGESDKAALGVLVLTVNVVHQALARPFRETLHSALSIGVHAATAVVLFSGSQQTFALRRSGVLLGLGAIAASTIAGIVADVTRVRRLDNTAGAMWSDVRRNGESAKLDANHGSKLDPETSLELSPVGAVARSLAQTHEPIPFTDMLDDTDSNGEFTASNVSLQSVTPFESRTSTCQPLDTRGVYSP